MIHGDRSETHQLDLKINGDLKSRQKMHSDFTKDTELQGFVPTLSFD